MFTKSTSLFVIVIALALLAGAFGSCNKGGDETGNSPATQSPAADGSAAATPGAPAAAAGGSGESAAAPGQPADAGGAGLASDAGRDVFTLANCSMCHGSGLGGSTLAPALKDLKANWDAAKLKQYLADPPGYAEKDPRLAEQIKQYTSMKMPAWSTTGLDNSDRDILIDWLLEQ